MYNLTSQAEIMPSNLFTVYQSLLALCLAKYHDYRVVLLDFT